jgi:hypothetical protein
LSVSWFFNPVRASGHSASRTAFPAANHVSLASMIEDRTPAEAGGTTAWRHWPTDSVVWRRY